mmetsp:Transcript_3479/g.3040  ORF Transcript_3479/g.3040 Transcript_3479/m.3040 type:complete len:143 (+) Transcript_3479:1036-1464(+)
MLSLILSSTFYVILALSLTIPSSLSSTNPSWWTLCLYFILLSDQNFGVILRKLMDADVLLVSYQRAIQYTDLPQEAELVVDTDKDRKEAGWPTQGKIDFENVYMKYHSNQENYILRNLSFSIKHGEKIGCVGRTGAGKSSLL